MKLFKTDSSCLSCLWDFTWPKSAKYCGLNHPHKRSKSACLVWIILVIHYFRLFTNWLVWLILQVTDAKSKLKPYTVDAVVIFHFENIYTVCQPCLYMYLILIANNIYILHGKFNVRVILCP